MNVAGELFSQPNSTPIDAGAVGAPLAGAILDEHVDEGADDRAPQRRPTADDHDHDERDATDQGEVAAGRG